MIVSEKDRDEEENVDDLETLMRKWKRLVTMVKLLDIRGNLQYMLLCYLDEKIEKSGVCQILTGKNGNTVGGTIIQQEV